MGRAARRNGNRSRSGIADLQRSRAKLMAVAVAVTVGGLLSVPAELMGIGTRGMALGATKTWTGTGTANWNNTAAWGGSAIPGSADTAQFNNTSTTNLNTVLQQDVSVLGLTLQNPSGNIGITGGAGNTLTLGAGGIDMSTATHDLLINPTQAIALGAQQTWTVNTNRTLTVTSGVTNGANLLIIDGAGSTIVSGVIGNGNGGLTKTGAGMLTLSGSFANTYTGTTTVNGGMLVLAKNIGVIAIAGNITLGDGDGVDVLRISNSEQIADTSIITFNGTGTNAGTFRVNNQSETIGGLCSTGGAGIVENGHATTAGAGTLATNVASGIQTFGGILRNNDGTRFGTLAFTKSGTGTQVLTGANTYTGNTTISGGVLRASDGVGLPSGGSSGNLIINGGVWESSTTMERAGGTGAGQMQITGGTSGFSSSNAAGVQVAFGTTGSPTALSWGTAPFNPATLVLNESTATGPLAFLNAINLGASARTVNVNADTATISGILSGTGGGLTKGGTGTLVLSGTNSYTGATTINAGVLSVGTLANGGAASGIGQSTNAASNLVLGDGTLQYTGGTVGINRAFTINAGTTGTFDVATAGTNLTISGAAANTSGALTKTGAGTLTLSGGNSYTGLTTVSAGTLAYGANNVIADTGTVRVSSGTLNIATYTDTVAGVQLLSGSITGTSGVLTSSSAYDMQSGTASAILAGSVALNKTTGGTVTLSGNNTYSGVTTISGGTLQVGDGGTTGTLGTNGAIVDNGNLTVNRSNPVTFGQIISGSGSLTQAGPGTTTLTNSANSYTGLTTVSVGTLAYGANNVISTGAVTVNGSSATLALGAYTDTVGTVTLDGGGSITGNALTTGLTTNTGTFEMKSGSVSAVLSGTGALNKTTGGTVTLSGANTYTGLTTIEAGTLDVSGSIASAVDVNSGGTLAGSGRLGGLATVQVKAGGTIAPGTGHSAGTLTTVGQIWSPQGKYEVDITAVTGDGAQTGVGTSYDTLVGTTLNLGGLDSGNKFTLLVDGQSLSDGSFVYGKTYTWDIASFTQGITFAQDYGIANINSLFAISLSYSPTFRNGQWSVSATGGTGISSHLYLSYNAVPEAGTVVFGALALMPLLIHRRRRRADPGTDGSTRHQ